MEENYLEHGENDTRAVHNQILGDWDDRTWSQVIVLRLFAEIVFLCESQLSDSFRLPVSLTSTLSQSCMLVVT